MEIKNIAIVGGTHGNEYTGVYLIKKLQQEKFDEKWNGLNISLKLANVKAYEQAVRFVDYDLNRSFSSNNLNDNDLSSYEANIAKVINAKLGPKGNPKTDMIIDLHTTTSNMGVCIILIDDNQYNFEMAAYVKNKVPNTNIYYMPKDTSKDNGDLPFLVSISKYGFTVEIGPIANSLVRHDILNQTKAVVDSMLEYVSKTNAGLQPIITEDIEVFKQVGSVNFPLDDNGNIDGYIHESLQDHDFKPIQKNLPIFEKLSDEVIRFEGDGTYYPVFINEAAYYSQKLAFVLTEKIIVNVSSDKLNSNSL
jgi:aspartoacylase